MRAECEFQDWLEVCSIPLYWQEVRCDIYENPDVENKPKEEESGGSLPVFVVYPVLFLSWLWEMQVVMMVTLPWWFGLFAIAMFDYALDILFWALFGWYCSFCAGIFVWIVNILHLPFTILGWLQRLFLETFSFIIDGWMLFFGNGCYLFFGNDCLLQSSEMFWILDIPWFTTDVDAKIPSTSLMSTITEQVTTIPEITSFSHFWQVRGEHRKNFQAMIPVLRELQSLYTLVSEAAFAL